MVLAYKNGAKYIIIFDYPQIEQYGILTDAHFDAIKKFWNYVQSNPHGYGEYVGEVAYVLPEDYGFGFRSPEDKIWGLWGPDVLSQKVWEDADTLIARYGSSLDIVYDDSEVFDAVRGRYRNIFFWNGTIK